MKSIQSLFIIALCTLLVFPLSAADKVTGTVSTEEGTPIVNAFVHWQGSAQAVATDAEGRFEISLPEETDSILCAEYIGYARNCIKLPDMDVPARFEMRENVVMDEVEITGTVSGRTKNRYELLNAESITSRELSRAACCSLSESFETNPSVDVSYSDAVTGAKQIQLLGLAGTYVQMLTENYPNFRGIASLYGMDYVPGPWMQSIQVSKGAASVKNGYESTTGQINVEYKKPHQADPLSLNLFASDAGRYEGNLDGDITLNDRLSTGLFLHYSTENEQHDANKDTFLDMPKRRQVNVMNRWHYQTPELISQSGVKFVHDKRTNGQMSGTQNPDGLTPYIIGVETNRFEAFTKNGYIFDNDKAQSVALILSGTYHDHHSHYGLRPYDVEQTNLYASLMYESNLGEMHKISTGVSMNYDHYYHPEQGDLPLNGEPEKETTSGMYVEYTFNPGERFTLLAGLRADYSSLHDWFVTPRLHLKYNAFDWMHLRASAGKGYRTAFALSENNYLMASSRQFLVVDKLEQESAWNYGASASFYIPLERNELSLNAEYFYTRFDNQVVIDLDRDSHRVYFYNLTGRSDAKVFQVEASYSPIRGLTLLGAYRHMDTEVDYLDGRMQKPLMSKYKALATASYETRLRKWQFDFTAQFNGGGRLPNPDAVTPLWAKEFKPYTILHAQITKNFRDWSIYIGGENLTDFKQKNPIVSGENPYSSDFDATMVWGPTMGRKFYVGIRYNITK